jgi:hypothetical protein
MHALFRALRAFALIVIVSAGFVACGGSASETPPPLEPNPRALIAPPEPSAKSASSAKSRVQLEESETPARPPPETWSSSRPRNRAAYDAGVL